MFGLTLPPVQRAIEALPGSRRCDRYYGWPEGQKPEPVALVRSGWGGWVGRLLSFLSLLLPLLCKWHHQQPVQHCPAETPPSPTPHPPPHILILRHTHPPILTSCRTPASSGSGWLARHACSGCQREWWAWWRRPALQACATCATRRTKTRMTLLCRWVRLLVCQLFIIWLAWKEAGCVSVPHACQPAAPLSYNCPTPSYLPAQPAVPPNRTAVQ